MHDMRKNQLRGTVRAKGETQVWVASMGLAVGLVMVVFLLGLIFWNGIRVFWPSPLVEIRLRDDSAALSGSLPIIAGEIVQIREPKIQGIEPGAREIQIFQANRDAYGASFKYLPESDALEMTYPPDLAIIERMEYGDAIGFPQLLKLSDGREISAEAPEFDAELARMIAEVGDRRKKITSIERGDIGAINSQMARLRRTVNRDGEESEAGKKALADIAGLQKSYEVLAAEARELRADQTKDILTLRLASGQERQIPVGEIVALMYPNQFSFLDKVGAFFSSIWHFLSGTPREANTEGGIFPAIFGTFVMTLIMSLAVVPFGVVAAIYLREYATQGLLVRSVRIAVNNLAGVPSIVFGVFGLGFFVYFVGGSFDAIFFPDKLPTPTFGTGGILWASLTLALMTVPVVIVATEEALAAVPRGVREGSLACGASKWQTIQRLVLPASTPGILTGLILAMARGAGEVAPLMLVGVVKLAPTLPLDGDFPFLHLERKFMHLGFHIFDLGFQSPDSEAAKPMVFATTLLLIALVLVLNLTAIILRERLRKNMTSGIF